MGIGEMGYNLTDGCSIYLDKQMKVFKDQLRHYASTEFTAETVRIPGKPQLCLDTMGSQLFL